MARRILHIVSAMNRGGAETLLMNVYRNLDRQMLQFDFVSHREECCDYDEEIEALGGRIYKIKSLGNQGPIGYIHELKKIMSGADYAAVHSHMDYQSGFPALSAKLAGIPIRICHSHSSSWPKGSGMKAGFMLRAMKAVIRYSATDYRACSNEAAQFLFGSSSKTRLLYNAIDLNAYENTSLQTRNKVRQELNIPAGSLMIGHVGTFSTSKNHRFLLQLLREMLMKGKKAVLVLVGEGALRPAIELEASQMGLHANIRFLGTRADVPSLMSCFDVFVFPSQFEGFGIAVLEAQAAGTPCVVSDAVPKLTDMGLGLIQYIGLDKSYEQWSESIDKALASTKPDRQTIHHKMSQKGFDIKQNLKQWLQMYGVS
ncbi:glycosyltransferase family 1 protein [Paenibacillus sp. IITD108]|uniref:glycosyltransferase family 1 protein n=1 Tax=Paenibacillus sp. IITD108 TaxID=3116649 RepID=UPI002F3E71E6